MASKIAFAAFLLAVGATGSTPTASIAQPHSTMRDIACTVRDGHVAIDFNGLRHPTFFGVLTPDDRFVYLVYPPERIDVLASAYRKDQLELDIQTQTGYEMHEGKKLPVRVFAQPGTYELRLQDANTAMGMTTHRLSCGVRLGPVSAAETRARSPHPCGPPIAGSTMPLMYDEHTGDARNT